MPDTTAPRPGMLPTLRESADFRAAPNPALPRQAERCLTVPQNAADHR
jgi:hypothetical protein